MQKQKEKMDQRSRDKVEEERLQDIARQLIGLPLNAKIRMGRAMKTILNAPAYEKREKPRKPAPAHRAALLEKKLTAQRASCMTYVTPPPQAMLEARAKREERAGAKA